MREKIQVEKEISDFEGLTESEKAKVLDNYRNINVDDNYWHECILDEFKHALELLGFSKVVINYTGFWSQGDGASFTGSFSVPRGKSELAKRAQAVLSEYPEFPMEAFLDMTFDEDDIEEGTLLIERIGHHYYHSNSITTYNESLKFFARTFSDFMYKQLEKLYDDLTSDNAVKDTIISNDYRFDTHTLKIFA